MPKIIDLPPLWLIGFLGLVWLIGRVLPLPLFGGAGDLAAAALLLAALVLAGGAAMAMAQARTTLIPHRQPAALVTHGVFRLSRNPIYLADTAILLAAILWLDVPLALPLVPLFQILIRERFIRAEEARLRAGFGADFDRWSRHVRRWL
ncbi:MAG: methyltransferase [Paracoccaceae bacterium]